LLVILWALQMFVTSSSCKAKYCLSASETAIGVISGVLVLSSENVKINLPEFLAPANFSVRLCSIWNLSSCVGIPFAKEMK
jgi:hypothetical protein